MSGLYSRWAQRQNINYYELLVFYALRMEGPVTQKLICENYEIPKQTVNTVIASMKKDGYIILDVSAKDRRQRLVTLTEKVLGYSEKILTPIYEIEENVVKRIGEKTIRELVGAATEFSDVMEQEIEKQENTL